MWGGVQNPCGGVFEQRQTNHIADANSVDRMRNTNTGSLGLSSSAWPTLQHAKQQQFYNPAKQQSQINNQQFGSGMRAVFLGNGSGRRESAGTGVFLPRRVDRPAESRKKPGECFFYVFLSVFKLKSCFVRLFTSFYFINI